ncbi:MAG: ethanolamine ammonia-lyase subunit EutB [Gemmataceae bacterium]
MCDVHELISSPCKINRPSKADTPRPARHALLRLQPNHPTDDPRGVGCMLVYRAFPSAPATSHRAQPGDRHGREHLRRVAASRPVAAPDRRRPTPVASGHIKTQLACLERVAPVEVMFQSLAGTDRTAVEEFDITVDLLDRAYKTMRDTGPLRDTAEQFMYFETGQGSEFTYGKHNDIDMATTEALCYGLARRYDPFMVNNVTGFIGPETHLDSFEMVLANLQDHFMGKLLGLPMGMAPCYTLHSNITLEGQQIATELLTAAGANYYMDVCLNTDRMLAYFDTSGHDDQTLREIHHKRPAPEFLDWGIERGIFARDNGDIVRGPTWGDPRQFCSAAEMRDLLAATPAAYGFTTAGPRPANAVMRQLKLNQSIGREAIHAELDLEALGRLTACRVIETEATSKEAHLNSPDLGARLSAKSRAGLHGESNQAQILITEGLSAEAVHHNAPDLLPLLEEGLTARGLRVGKTLVARYGRVKLAEPVAERLGADLVIHLIGERPGGDALASRSLSAYLVYRLSDPEAQRQAAKFSGAADIRYEYTVISNIYSGGLPPAEAAGVIVERAGAILKHQAAGNRLESLLKAT